MDSSGNTEEMNIVVFGANGPAGRLVVAQAAAAGHRVSAVTRHPGTFPVRASGLDWTVLRPAGLFDAPDVGDYRIGTTRLPGRYTARPDLVRELLRQAGDHRHAGAFVDVRTTVGTPTPGELLREEALGRRCRRPSA
nr:hypothetical protein StreXyl84_37820 [Streptomyces sp. Xyl84]